MLLNLVNNTVSVKRPPVHVVTSFKSALRSLLWVISIQALYFVLYSSADAQQSPKIRRLEFVPVTGSTSAPGVLIEGLRQGLPDLGYTEGRNIEVEYRWPSGRRDQLLMSVTELVQLGVAVGATNEIRVSGQSKDGEAHRTISQSVLARADRVIK